MDEDRVKEVARGLTEAQRRAILSCGDVEDSFPCGDCNAPSPSGCWRFSLADRVAAAAACNDASGPANGSGYDALRSFLLSQSQEAGK